MAMSSWIDFCASVMPSTTSSSVTSSAPPSTITIESFDPVMMRSMSLYSSCWKVGLMAHFPSRRPMRTPASGWPKGILEALSASETARSDGTSASFCWSAETT